MIADAVEFDFKLVGTGWARARLAVGSKSVELTASYLGDALGDLLAAMSLLVAGEPEARFSWDEEPGEYRWIVSCADDVARTRVLAFEHLRGHTSDDEGRELFNGSCSLRALIAAVARAAHDVLDEWGIEGYRLRWVEHDFPAHELDQLDRYLAR